MRKIICILTILYLFIFCLSTSALQASSLRKNFNITNGTLISGDSLKTMIEFNNSHITENFLRRNEENIMIIAGTLFIALLSVLLSVLLTHLCIKKRESKKKIKEYFALLNNIVLELNWQKYKRNELKGIVQESKRILAENKEIITDLSKGSLSYAFLNYCRKLLLKHFKGSKEIIPFLTYYVNQSMHINSALDLSFVLDFKILYEEDTFYKKIDSIFLKLLKDIDTLNKIVDKLEESLAKEISGAPRKCKPTLFSIPKDIKDRLN